MILVLSHTYDSWENIEGESRVTGTGTGITFGMMFRYKLSKNLYFLPGALISIRIFKYDSVMAYERVWGKYYWRMFLYDRFRPTSVTTRMNIAQIPIELNYYVNNWMYLIGGLSFVYELSGKQLDFMNHLDHWTNMANLTDSDIYLITGVGFETRVSKTVTLFPNLKLYLNLTPKRSEGPEAHKQFSIMFQVGFTAKDQMLFGTLAFEEVDTDKGRMIKTYNSVLVKTVMGEGYFELNAGKRIKENDYFLILRHRTYVQFFNKLDLDNVLEIYIDKKKYSVGTTTNNYYFKKEVGDKWEVIYIPVSHELIKKIAKSKRVRIIINGKKGYVVRVFDNINYKKFKKFIKENK